MSDVVDNVRDLFAGRQRRLTLLAISLFITIGAPQGTWDFLYPKWFSSIGHQYGGGTGITYAYEIAIILSTIGCGWFMDRVSAKRLWPVVLLSVPFTILIWRTSHSTGVVLGGIILFLAGFGRQGMWSLVAGYFPVLFPTRLRGTGMGVTWVGGWLLGYTLSAEWGTQLQAHVGWNTWWIVQAVLLALVPLPMIVAGVETHGRELDFQEEAEPARRPDPGATTAPGGGRPAAGDLVGVRDARHRDDRASRDRVSLPNRTVSKPTIAITMGDGAGVGPEIIMKVHRDPSILQRCVPVVIGDATRLRDASEIVGTDLVVDALEDVAQADPRPGHVACLDLDRLPDDLPWGELSAAAGDAAFHYVACAARLAMDGGVQGICTAPLNKEALHAAGHAYPGHTELLAELTGTEEVSMMLTTPQLKVIHVTTHVGLLDAVARIEPGLVYRTIARGHAALGAALGRPPRVAVCAINPHAGEHGLFGHGEEETKIAPGVQRAARDGIDVHGPLPADTAFFRAVRGDFDLVVAMYHDQGHGPVKVLGVDTGINVTVGLPVVRTSVDHGTAFDIAGTGQAQEASMHAALEAAIELAAAR